MTPPAVSILPDTVAATFAPRVTAPVPRFSELLPTNVKPAFQVWTLLLLSVFAEPLVLSIVPPLTVNLFVPIAVALLMFSWPAERVIPPENVFAPETVRVPPPVSVSGPVPETTLSSDSVLPAEIVKVRAAAPTRRSGCYQDPQW